MISILDSVVRQLDDEILSFDPELGGALLGPRHSPVVSKFIKDVDALTTSVSYVPSTALGEQVIDSEERMGCELKGIVHSHPGALDVHSGPDHQAFTNLLRVNPQLPSIYGPILTQRSNDNMRFATHELALGNGKLSSYMVRRTRDGGVAVSREPVRVLPLSEDVRAVADDLNAESVVDGGIVEIDGRTMFAWTLGLTGQAELIFLFGLDYPVLPPIPILGFGESNSQELDLSWSVESPERGRLQRAVREHFSIGKSRQQNIRPAWGPTIESPLTDSAEIGRAADWDRVFTNKDVRKQALTVRKKSLARTCGLMPKEIRRLAVCLFGAGSVGSYIVDQLVRSGVDNVTMVDSDEVDPENIAKTIFDLKDVGAKKVDALARRLLNINPALNVEGHAAKVDELGSATLNQIIDESDLVIAATDDPRAQSTIARFAFARKKPAIFVGMYAGAKGGEIVLSVPGYPCFNCATNFRRAMERESGTVSSRTDYGTGRLDGEVALAADIQHVASAAVKLALSLVAPKEMELSKLANGALKDGATYLLMGMTPNYWIFPETHAEALGQHAFQSVWAGVESDPHCSICGDEEFRADPLDIPLAAPTTAEWRMGIALQKSASETNHEKAHSKTN